MRISIIAIWFFVASFAHCDASTFVLATGSDGLDKQFQVYGLIPIGGAPFTIQFTAVGTLLPDPVDPTDPSQQSWYNYLADVNFAQITLCQNNFSAGSYCRYYPSHPSDILGSFDPFLDVHIEGSTSNVADFSYTLSIDLPDGLSLSPPVPEPSTWTMLLLGFVGIGLMRRRRSCTPEPQ
jgi:hypothetical protein